LRREINEPAGGGKKIVTGEGARGEGGEERDIALAVHVPLHVGEAGGGVGRG
jgi:hypothetical protein